MQNFEQRYPHVAAWVQDGWIEIGNTGDDPTFIRVFNEGGMIWSGGNRDSTIDDALAAANSAIAAQGSAPVPDLIVGTFEPTSFTHKQGQYLAFIYNYTQIHRQPPAQADIQRYFRVTPPTVHQMILKLEELGLLSRIPGEARAIRVLVPPQALPILGG